MSPYDSKDKDYFSFRKQGSIILSLTDLLRFHLEVSNYLKSFQINILVREEFAQEIILVMCFYYNLENE